VIGKVLEAERDERILTAETVDVTLPGGRAPRGVPAGLPPPEPRSRSLC